MTPPRRMISIKCTPRSDHETRRLIELVERHKAAKRQPETTEG